MGWDQSRPVPWQRLMREWVIYVGVMALIFVLLFRDNGLQGALAGLLISGPLYVGFGYIMAKFGYQRRSLKELRNEPREPRAKKYKKSSDGDDDPVTSTGRSRPAPTKRTSGGGNRPKSKPRRR